MHCCYRSVTRFNLFYDPMDSSPPGSSVARQAPLGFPRQDPGVGYHFPLSGIFPPQGSNLCLLNWQVDSLALTQQGNLGPWLPRVCYCAIHLGLEDNESQRKEQSTSPFLLCWLRLNVSSHLLLPSYWDLWHLFHWFSGLRALNYITTFLGLQLAESSYGPSFPPLSFEVIPHNKSSYLYACSCTSSLSICFISSVPVKSIPLTPQFKCKNVSCFPPNLKKLFGWVHSPTTFIIKGVREFENIMLLKWDSSKYKYTASLYSHSAKFFLKSLLYARSRTL